MKIAHLVSTFPPYRGGMGNTAAQFAEMHAVRHKVTVFTPCYGENTSPADTVCFREERLASPLRYGNAAALPQLMWRLRSFDMVYLHYPFYGTHLAVLLACLLWRCKLVLHYHMDSLATGVKGHVFEFNRRLVLPLLVKQAEVIVGASLDYMASSHVAHYLKADPGKFREIPFWVDTQRFQPAANSTSEEIVALFVGGLDQAHYFKGLEILLRSIQASAGKSRKRIILRVVGSGALLAHYQKLADSLGISDKVWFLGRLDDAALTQAYREASFLVLPSINQGEAFGLVLLEAMASGKPVIASNLPGVRSVFTDGKEGLVVRVGDAEDLAEKMLRLADDDALRDQMGRRARDLVLSKYQVEVAAKQLEDICLDMAANR